jgi:3-deoxy-D-manno-octulosonic-acid transferase
MYLAYSFLLTLGFLLLVPRFIFHAFTHGKYVAGFRERLGSIPANPNNKRPVVWLHCVSVGETQAARPLVRRLQKEFPQYSLVISTITLTGQRLAQDVFRNEADNIFYFPFDWRWTVRRALANVDPVVVLIMETELWPNFLRECQLRGIPVGLVNGRISRQSFRRYSLIKFFFKRVLSGLDIAVMQSEADEQRIHDLGFPAENLFTSGNLKFDAGAIPAGSSATAELRKRFNLDGNVPLILAASTHDPEEKIILESLRQLRTGVEKPRLMLAPRHPERFQEVASLLESSGFAWSRRTATPQQKDSFCDVILLDTIGELPAAYPLAAIVFVGGSIAKKGGHNVLEPAAAGACVVTGAYTDNFEAIINLLDENSAIVQLPPLKDRDVANRLTEVLDDLLMKPQLRKELGNRARQLVVTNQGAADKTIELISPLFSEHTAANSQLKPLLASDARTS